MAITRGEIIEAIHKGTGGSNKKYEKWSNGMWVTDSGVEGLMVACIAEAVNKSQEQHESLVLEMSFGGIKDSSKAKPKPGPPPAALKGANRADIVLFNGSDRPTCVIEVKRSWNAGQCWGDLERIRDLVRSCSYVEGGSLKRGFLAMMIAKKANAAKSPKNRIDEQVDKIKEVVKTEFEKRGQGIDYHLGKAIPLGGRFREFYGDWRAASFCIEIASRKQVER